DFGEGLDAITLENTGTLPNADLSSVTLVHNGTEVARDTDPTGGFWVLDPAKGAVHFGRDGTNISVHVAVAPNATANRTVDLRIPSVQDGGTPGAYDHGDLGLFYQQDDPIGGLDPEGSLTIEALAGVELDVTAEPTAAGNATRLTLEFSANVSAASTALSDFRVNTTGGNRVNVTGLRDDDGDGNLSVVLEAGHLPDDLASITVGNGVLRRLDGAGLPALSASLPGAESRPTGRTYRQPLPTLRISLPEGNLTTDSDFFDVRIHSSIGDRTVEVRMVRASNGSVTYGDLLAVDTEGTANVSLPRVPGRFNLSVTDTLTGTRNWTGPFEIERVVPVARFQNDSFTVERGETVVAQVELRHETNTTVQVERPNGLLVASWSATDRDGDGRANVSVNTTYLGRWSRNTSVDPAAEEDDASHRVSHPDVDAATRRFLSVHRSARAAAQPLDAGRYTLSLSVRENVTDLANLTVTERWSADVQTLVAPAGLPVTDPSAVLASATARNAIARGDTVVLAYHVSGIADFPPPVVRGGRISVAPWRGIGAVIGPAPAIGENRTERGATPGLISVGAKRRVTMPSLSDTPWAVNGSLKSNRQNRTALERPRSAGSRTEPGNVTGAERESEPGAGSSAEAQPRGVPDDVSGDGDRANASAGGPEAPRNGSVPPDGGQGLTSSNSSVSVARAHASSTDPFGETTGSDGATVPVGPIVPGRVAFRGISPDENRIGRTGLKHTNVTVLPDYEQGTLYLILGSKALAWFGTEGEDHLRANLVVNESSPYLWGEETNGTVGRETIGANLSVVPPRASFRGVRSNGTLLFRDADNVTLEGETNVAPGTAATVHVATVGRDGTDRSTETTQVTEAGEYSTTIGLPTGGDQSEYEVWVTANGERISPIRSGRLLESDPETAPAMTGGTGNYQAGSSREQVTSTPVAPRTTTAGPTTTTITPTVRQSPTVTSTTHVPSRTTNGWVFPTRLPDIPSVPWRIGIDALLLWAVGALAVVVSLVGFRRLI
ncbi:MAG: hypothetical protein ABEJ44_01130, partial [Halanaeroarchaeum sp.]